MKRVFFFMAMALMSVVAFAQEADHYNEVVWLNGKVMYAAPLPTIDSITFVDEVLEQDTLHLLLPRTIVKSRTVYIRDTVYVKDTVYIQYCPDTVSDKPLSGAFSVSATKQVRFSKGNLQYTQSTQTWSFADNQYDMIGDANVSGSDLADKIDLFGWSGSTGSAKWGIGTSKSASDYSGDFFVDWGINTIGTDAQNTWRTLTIDEWEYLLMHTRWTMAKVNGSLGFMLLPADFVAPQGLLVNILGDGNMSGNHKNFNESDYSSNVYTVSQFSQLEAAGVVFLPCAGFRDGSSARYVGAYGYYWSATPYGTDDAKDMYFDSSSANTYGGGHRYDGHSVRLVQDIK